MGIYIKGMEMPKDCFHCHLSFMRGERLFCSAMKNEEVLRAKIDPNCPLVPVPPHGRLIDADALMKTCGMATDCYDCPNGEYGWCGRSQDAANICEAIEDAPTIIETEGGSET